MPGDAHEGIELPDRPHRRSAAWDDEDIEVLDGPAATSGDGAAAVADEDDADEDGEDDGPGDDTDPSELDPDEDVDGEDEVDFAVVAYREEGRWHVDPLPTAAVDTWDGFRRTVAGRSGETGVIGFASIDESALVVLRLTGGGQQVLLSDVETADYLVFADDLVEQVRRTDPAVDEMVESTDFGEAEDPVPVGDLGLLGDLGLSADDLRDLCEDLGGEPEDLLDEIGEALGLGAALADAVDAAAST